MESAARYVTCIVLLSVLLTRLGAAAAKTLSAVILTHPELLSGTLWKTVAPVIIKRFTEREDSVRLDVFATFIDLARKWVAICTALLLMVVCVDRPDGQHQQGNRAGRGVGSFARRHSADPEAAERPPERQERQDASGRRRRRARSGSRFAGTSEM